jgi:hypothetical protein
MATTYEKIASTTLATANTSITFSSIPSTYTDLRIVFTPASYAGGGMFIRCNSDTGTNYSHTRLTTDGASLETYNAYDNTYWLLGGYVAGATSTTGKLHTIDIFSYAGATYKTMLHTYSGDKNAAGEVSRTVQLWRSTSAINTILLSSTSSTYGVGTVATIYGILKA